jgi:hypothetical protein
MSCAPHQVKKIVKICEMMLERGVSEADLEALNDVRFDLMAIARRCLNKAKASAGEEMDKALDTIDTEVLSSDHSHD